MESNTCELLVQGSQEWHLSRLGRFTCSEFYRLMTDCIRQMTDEELDARPKGSTKKTVLDLALLSDGARTYVYEKVGELLTGQRAKDEVSSKATEWGHEYEPEAKRYYESVFKVNVQTVGNIVHDARTSGSPDGLVNSDGGIEIKCPYLIANHVENLLLTSVEEFKDNHKDYYWQIMGLLHITGRRWFDFVSYHPLFEGSKRMQVIRIHRNTEDLINLGIKLKSATLLVSSILDTI